MTATAKPSDSVVIAAIHAEPSIRKLWKPLSKDQKRRVLEKADGCTDGKCLMKVVEGMTKGEKSHEIICGDALAVLKTLPNESVQCCVTSPPYFGLRDYSTDPILWGGDPNCEHLFESQTKRSGGAYKQGSKKRWQHSANDFTRDDRFLDGHPEIPAGDLCSKCSGWIGNLGLEPRPQLFVRNLTLIFLEVRRVMKKDATLWLNLGDSYWGSGKGLNADGIHSSIVNNRPGDKQFTNKGSLKTKISKYPDDLGLKPKDLMGTPWRVAFALQEAGFWLRQDIIWSKPNPMPESVTDRCTKAHEYIFLLTKSESYYYDAAAVREIGAGRLDFGQMTSPARLKQGSPWIGGKKEEFNGRNKRSVWEVSTAPFPDAHFATFPPKLIEPCILAGSKEGDLILDPFAGAGTTLLVAKRLGRKSLGIELNPEYIEIAEKRLENWHRPNPPKAKPDADGTLPLFNLDIEQEVFS